MIEVRIRHQDYPFGIRLGDVPLNDRSLEDIIALVRRWGLYVPDPGLDFATDVDLTGQFVLDHEKGRAYFEIVVNDPE